ncbi:DMT family transporter [Helicobacter anatolicus]|uniref:DMT family transporter n=1 Tax=Helicobacter anatolicus TaxID=2905874 RepID=UPI001E39869E|nr:multidrug efflux SMR transporter [Helicobacter anatolicus]MCE3039405.1 multidrug efflux SMR transporter [Helicobacter anatolicus]
MLWLLLGVVAEIFWVSGLKYFSDNLPGIISIVIGVCISFSSLIMACKKMEVSIAYAMFVGLGTFGVVCIDIFYFKQDFTKVKLFLILVLMIGIIGLKLIKEEKKS